MAVKTFTTGEVLTASDTNTYLNNGGLVFVKQVTVGTAVASVDVTSCFSADYDNYVVSYSGITTSSAAAFYGYLLSGTTPTSSGVYGNTFYIVTGAAGALSNSARSNSTYFECGSHRNGDGNNGTVCINGPFLTQYTRISFISTASDYWRLGSDNHQAATSYNGFRLQAGGGTMTGGKIAVYGYRLG
jgi:hypothetical protein